MKNEKIMYTLKDCVETPTTPNVMTSDNKGALLDIGEELVNCYQEQGLKIGFYFTSTNNTYYLVTLD